MAMKVCKECGTEISSSAKVCPKCGKKQKMSKGAIGAIVVLLLIVIVAASGGDSSNNNTNSIATSTTPNEQQEVEELLEVDYKILWQDYQDNAIGADAKYKGKLLKLTGEIEDINREIAGNPYVTFQAGDYSFYNVRLTFKKSEEEKISTLAKGQQITIKGECAGLLLTSTVSLNDCEIIE